MSTRAPQTDLERQLAATHKRFVKAMEERMGTMSDETREAYFAILSKLVAKLERLFTAKRIYAWYWGC